jgi:hypothetical protein
MSESMPLRNSSRSAANPIVTAVIGVRLQGRQWHAGESDRHWAQQ